jgi:hypothetical protein
MSLATSSPARIFPSQLRAKYPLQQLHCRPGQRRFHREQRGDQVTHGGVEVRTRDNPFG